MGGVPLASGQIDDEAVMNTGEKPVELVQCLARVRISIDGEKREQQAKIRLKTRM